MPRNSDILDACCIPAFLQYIPGLSWFRYSLLQYKKSRWWSRSCSSSYLGEVESKVAGLISVQFQPMNFWFCSQDYLSTFAVPEIWQPKHQLGESGLFSPACLNCYCRLCSIVRFRFVRCTIEIRLAIYLRSGPSTLHQNPRISGPCSHYKITNYSYLVLCTVCPTLTWLEHNYVFRFPGTS